MRRALAIGLALYLALGGVLSSPVQVQAPFELNKNTPEVGDVLASASEFQPFFVCFFFSAVVCRLSVNVRPGSREPRLTRTVVT